MKLSNKKIGKSKYPEKDSINLLIKESQGSANPKFQIAIFIVFIIILLVFVKFMVIDVISKASTAQSEYESMQEKITNYKTSNEEFNKIREEYSHYGNGYLNDEESVEADRESMLNVIEKDVSGNASITSVEISQNVAAVTVKNVTLKTVSVIVANVEKEKAVSFVSVSTAGTGQDENAQVSATLAINFKEAGGAQ